VSVIGGYQNSDHEKKNGQEMNVRVILEEYQYYVSKNLAKIHNVGLKWG